MLKLSLKRGDAVHVVFADGSNGIIEARSRCELGMHLPKKRKGYARERRIPPRNLIKRNQK